MRPRIERHTLGLLAITLALLLTHSFTTPASGQATTSGSF